MVRLTFFGHAAFLLETAGVRVVFDPYKSPDCGGFAPINVPADLVVVSHENDRYHSHLGQLIPPFEVVRGLEIPEGGQYARGLRFEAIRVFETPERLPGDEVTIVHTRAEGLHVVHLGDLGHLLAPHELAPIVGADVVMCPAGGTPTIDLSEVGELLQALAPKVVIPMHYLVPGKINLKIAPIERFLEAIQPLAWPVRDDGGSCYDSSRDTLPERATIVRLKPSR